MSEQELYQRLQQLEARNAQLERINQVLIERVESCAGQQMGPWQAFEHSVTLAEQVRERTDALNQTLQALKSSHQELTRANRQAALSHQRLEDAIESISDGFALFDPKSRLLLANQKFSSLWRAVGVEIGEGTTIEDIERLACDCGLIATRSSGGCSAATVFQLPCERWIQLSERPTTDGGRVVLVTDITDLKAEETRRREQALAQKNRLLQQTVGNLSQGVMLVNPAGRLELWNQRFVELTGIDCALLDDQPELSTLTARDPQQLLHPSQHLPMRSVASERLLNDGRVIEVRTHPLSDGGFINTYTDITERYHHARQLLESERWIRLITDQVPALIAYVDHQLFFSFTNRVYDEWYGCARGVAER